MVQALNVIARLVVDEISPDNSRAARYSLLVANSGPTGKNRFFVTIVKSI